MKIRKMKIYHIADIHIRKGRKEEYVQVFDNLFATIKESYSDGEQSYLVIAGDILHDSTSICSETFYLFDYFFSGLLLLNINVVIIPGNHDFSGPDDILKGLLFSRKYKNVVYLDTHVPFYEYENVIFYTIPCKKIKKTSKKTILLHHSSVVPSLAIRNLFSFTLLGDNHQRQFITENCAYPGSLIQQNFKENKQKGIILWDIEKMSGKYIDIASEYAYENIIFGINSPEDFRKNSKISIEYNIQDSNEIEPFVESIKKKTNVISLVKKIARIPLSKVTENQNSIFESLISLHPEETMKKLTDLHLRFSDDNNFKNISECSSWKLKDISFEGLYSYHSKNNIVFKDGVTGIIEENASGKTSIMNIIFYSIFGTVTKTKSLINRNIINKNSKKYSIRLNIIFDNGNNFEIFRKGSNKKRKNGSFSMDESIQLKMNDKDITGSNKIDSSKKILEILGLISRDIFANTNVMNNSSGNFLDMKSGEISDILTKLYSLDYYSKIQENINSQIYKNRKKINEIEYCENIVKNISDENDFLDVVNLKKMIMDYACDINGDDTRKNIIKAIDGYVSREVLIKNVPDGKEECIEYERILKIYRECVSDKGIPKILMRDYVKNIENIANSLIESITDLKLYFSEDCDSKWGFMFKRKDFYLGVESISGFEKFIATIALKTAISSTCHYSVCDTFFIDESFDCISDTNLHNVEYIFDWLRQNGLKKIIIISHNKEIAKKIDNRIKISNFSILF